MPCSVITALHCDCLFSDYTVRWGAPSHARLGMMTFCLAFVLLSVNSDSALAADVSLLPAASHHFHAVKRPVDGPVEDEGIKAADAEKVHIVAMQLPMSKTLPDQVLRALRATKSALLLYKQGAEG